MKTALFMVALFVGGAVFTGLVGLYISLPPSTVECSDMCGGRALGFALRCALAGGLLLTAIGWAVAKVRRRN